MIQRTDLHLWANVLPGHSPQEEAMCILQIFILPQTLSAQKKQDCHIGALDVRTGTPKQIAQAKKYHSHQTQITCSLQRLWPSENSAARL